ncbi:hypothetical protein OH76DRAFT_136021 [Lentinus brumalis]|uniref:Uncharacterized protein n=1 Tax=Lentinus brumalis TaxID=2498619 RepID=A0A371CPP2_9APHY|nr:hypothetical protein OH76DRAFT_136021 [Polyporus brumalis]
MWNGRRSWDPWQVSVPANTYGGPRAWLISQDQYDRYNSAARGACQCKLNCTSEDTTIYAFVCTARGLLLRMGESKLSLGYQTTVPFDHSVTTSPTDEYTYLTVVSPSTIPEGRRHDTRHARFICHINHRMLTYPTLADQLSKRQTQTRCS